MSAYGGTTSEIRDVSGLSSAYTRRMFIIPHRAITRKPKKNSPRLHATHMWNICVPVSVANKKVKKRTQNFWYFGYANCRPSAKQNRVGQFLTISAILSSRGSAGVPC
jgi:hypothetical protein